MFLWLALIWTAIVTFFCLVSFNELPTIGIKNSDKFGHITFHYGLTTLWFLYFRFQRQNEDGKSFVKAFMFSFVYGVMIEVSQALFTDTRKADIFDVFANIVGASLAVLTFIFILSRNKAEDPE